MHTLTFLSLTHIKIIVMQLLVLSAKMYGFVHSLNFSTSKSCNNLLFIGKVEKDLRSLKFEDFVCKCSTKESS